MAICAHLRELSHPENSTIDFKNFEFVPLLVSAWVYPVHDHAIIAEMPDGEPHGRIEIRACQHEPGVPCPQCDLAVRRFAYLLKLMFIGCADVVRSP